MQKLHFNVSDSLFSESRLCWLCVCCSVVPVKLAPNSPIGSSIKWELLFALPTLRQSARACFPQFNLSFSLLFFLIETVKATNYLLIQTHTCGYCETEMTKLFHLILAHWDDLSYWHVITFPKPSRVEYFILKCHPPTCWQNYFFLMTRGVQHNISTQSLSLIRMFNLGKSHKVLNSGIWFWRTFFSLIQNLCIETYWTFQLFCMKLYDETGSWAAENTLFSEQFNVLII